MDAAAKLAAAHVKQILAPHKKDNSVSVLNDWLSFIEHSAQVIALLVPDDLNAYVMFETLNDRGVENVTSRLGQELPFR